LNTQAQVGLGGSIVLQATPEGVTSPSQVSTAPSGYSAAQQPYGQGYAAHSLPVNRAYESSIHTNTYHVQSGSANHQSLRVLSWSGYVNEHLNQYENGFKRFVVWFYLVTGMRETPWIKAFGAIGFDAFDGYIIPDFKGSADTVVATIEQKIGQLTQYEDTDCFIAQLTDAHIVDSATQDFKGAEFFPFQRKKNSSKRDYRRFCVTSYHWVKNYLLVESYGSDLFVNWITRFEPPSSEGWLGIWTLVALITTFLAFFSQNIFLILAPFLLWASVFLLIPTFMQRMEILPKKANAMLLIGIMLILSFVMAPLGIIVILWSAFLQRLQSQIYDIPPLDLVDAKKLDDMISKQTELALKPLLQSNGYSEDQIAEILTRTSATGKTFRR
jgi:hypothetical protein